MRKSYILVLLLLVAAYSRPSVSSAAAGFSKQELRKGFIATISDRKDVAVPGELVTYTFTFKHVLANGVFAKINPVFGVEAKGIKVHNISNGGIVKNEVVLWEPVEMGYGQTVKRTFQITVPNASFGDKYCVNAGVGAMAVLPISVASASDCTKIVAKVLPEKTVKILFQQVFGRAIKPSESTYWNRRARTDKTTEPLLKGTMEYYKARGLTVGKT